MLLHSKAVTGKQTSLTHDVHFNLYPFEPINNIDFNSKQKLMKNKLHRYCSSFPLYSICESGKTGMILCTCQFLQPLCCTSENIIDNINGFIEIAC